MNKDKSLNHFNTCVVYPWSRFLDKKVTIVGVTKTDGTTWLRSPMQVLKGIHKFGTHW